MRPGNTCHSQFGLLGSSSTPTNYIIFTEIKAEAVVIHKEPVGVKGGVSVPDLQTEAGPPPVASTLSLLFLSFSLLVPLSLVPL